MRRSIIPRLSDADIGYIAGLFDGDGSITVIDNRHKAHVLSINIGNTHKPVLEWLRFTLGFGRLNEKRCAGYPGARKLMWYWETDCHAAEVFLRLIYAHLKVKRARADAALSYREEQRRSNFLLQPGACLPIRAMNRPDAVVTCRFERTA